MRKNIEWISWKKLKVQFDVIEQVGKNSNMCELFVMFWESLICTSAHYN